MKTILATGVGKLHFHETARALAAAGVEVNFLTGWVPRRTAAVNLIGGLLREPHLARRLAARRIDLPGVQVTPMAWTEAASAVVALVQRTGLLPLDLAYGIQFRLTAWSSRRHLRRADALLVRSGAGQSGAIETARNNGMAVVTDHSIAHPAFIHEILREEFERHGLKAGYNPRADIWKLVLRDCAAADLLMVNSEFVKRTFLERGYPESKIRVAYLGVNEKYFALKREYAISGPVKILFTGNFDLRKGVRVLLEAVRICRKGGLDVRLNLIGNLGNGAGCLLDSDWSFFSHTPFVPQEALTGALANADLFALPTFAEGSSRSGMEAAAAGLPLITTRNCGLPLEDRVGAIYVPVNDSESLAEAISELSQNRQLRESLGMSAMTTITENYTWERYGRRVAAILAEASALRPRLAEEPERPRPQ